MTTLNEDMQSYFKEQGLYKNINQKQTISKSAESYILALLGLKDARTNGFFGIDAVYSAFTPRIYFEIKTGLEGVKICDTQLFYDTSKSRYFYILVKREDNLKSYVKAKGKKYNVLHSYDIIDSLQFNFGNIHILPLEIIKEHFITQKTKEMIRYEENRVGKKDNYKNFTSLSVTKRKKARRDLELIIGRKRNGEEISDKERSIVGLSFGQAKQIIIGCGEHYRTFKNSKTLKQEYIFDVINGPLINPNENKRSKVFLMDIDDIVMNDMINLLTLSQENGKNKIQEINEIKKERLDLYKEIKDSNRPIAK